MRSLAFLGHINLSDGKEVDPKKNEAVRNWMRPLSPTHIRSFLGLAGYYRTFVDCFVSFAFPLTTLTQRVLNLSGRRHVKEVSNFLRIDLSPLQC